MKVPLSWLVEHVAVDLPLDELVEVMSRHGLEVEEVTRPGARVEGVVVARVVEVADHPDADRLVVATVDDGDRHRTVCVGVRNFAAGDLVPLALPGARLPTPDGQVMTIDARDMRGVVSDGMLCSARELRLADDHAGIVVLDPAGWPGGLTPHPGTDLRDLLPLGEPVIDVAVPADRGDLHSVLGVARDLGAILDVELRTAAAEPGRSTGEGPVPVEIAAPDGCARYLGWVMDGVEGGPSPWWLRRRLEVSGVRAVNNLVDVTNYVMLERGQPLHTFDRDRLAGPEIVVRWAATGERLTTLDGQDRVLESGDLVIADADGPVALAGVMGGRDSEVGADTERILLEAATFDAATVRTTARRLDVVSEASLRFERGVDPGGVDGAAARAVALLEELAGGRDAGLTAAGPGLNARETIRLDTAWAARFLGLDELTPSRQTALLRRAGATVDHADKTPDARGDASALLVTPPSWRVDLTRPADLAEELARLHGYERVPSALPPVALRGGLTRRQQAERQVRHLALGAGFHEAQTSPFVGADALCLLAPDDNRVRLANPPARDTDTLRPSLAEGLLASVRHNVGQGRDGLALFELGRVFRPAGGPLDDLLDGVEGQPAADRGPGPARGRWYTPDGRSLPTQPVALGLVAYGPKQGPRWLDRDRTWTVWDLLGVVDEVAGWLTADPNGSWTPVRLAVERPGLHPGRTAVLADRQGRHVGLVAQLHPDEAARRDLPETTVVAELLLEPLWAHLDDTPDLRQAVVVPRHPATTVDVAVVVDEEVSYAAVEEAVRTGAGDLLDRLRWFDEYRGAQLGAGRRSLAFNLRLQDPDRQLTDADAEAAIDRVAAAVAELGGELRR